MHSYQHIVVGGGISGMTSALLLAKQGYKTALVEKFPGLGPTVRGFSRKGVHFETGVHLLGGLGHNHPLDVYFRHLEISDELQKIEFEKSGYDCFRFERNDREIRMPAGYENLRETLCMEFPEESGAIGKYLSKIRSVFESSPYLNFNLDFSIEDAIHAETETLNEFLNSITSNRELKDLLCYQCMLYGTPPAEAMLSTHALVAGSYAMSCHTVEGGGSAIVRAYRSKLEKYGVEIITGRAVERITADRERRFTGIVLADGTELSGESCVWCAHPASMIECAPEDAFRPVFRKRIVCLEETPSAMIIFGTADAPLPELTRRNIYLWPEKDYSLILKGLEKPEDNAIFISAGQTTKTGQAQPITAISPCSFNLFEKWKDSTRKNRPADYLELKKKLTAELVKTVFERCPELRGRVKFTDSATPLTLKDYCGSPYGSMYGAAHTASQYNPLPATRMSGLFLAGQSIIAPGVLGAVVSAYLACGLICGHDKIHEELRCIYNG
ncbi:NAD(P)/FAD-dependent oxidoreductase [Maridesulfovibrio sp.]|uniref:phytoene desaturase family protein n=1 Tax=Maridesulfovibrio sp. TaxID=2795000 RepID=UPI002A1891A6|nr:NAD(P)/FAD-dependent oxidoreductase [Maridesulfovibrio sp.]